MKKTVIGYGLAMAVLVALLKLVEYQYLVRSLSMEIYIGIIAVFFTVLGIWIGLKVTSRPPVPAFSGSEPTLSQAPAFPNNPKPASGINQQALINLSISNREHEVLQLMALGLSNQEIADRLFVSLNTVKTHSSNLYAKLDVKRRTQAVQKAKELKIIS